MAYPATIYLDELGTQTLLQDWGAPQANHSVLGTGLQVDGVKYARGIGTHSISRFLLRLDGKATLFSGLAGADDHNDFGGNMEFRLYADKRLIWSSGILHKGMPAAPFRVDLKGVRQLAMIVTEGGDGIMYDHADWLDAKFETTGSIVPEPVTPKKIETPMYLLTPVASDAPALHGAKVLGVRPGHPILFTIPATGKRPMLFSADPLPRGLVLDKDRGLIRGTIDQAGTYNLVLRAENGQGADTRLLRIEVGERICLTPPMGWNSWNCWGLEVNEQKVKDAAECMEKDLARHGWTYVNIDDGWEADHRAADGSLAGNSKFPDFRGLCDYVHGKGLKFGIYSSPGPETCGGHLGSYGYEDRDALTWGDWGVDYLKYDYCYYSRIAPVPTERLIRQPYDVMRKSLDKVDRDIVYSIGFGAPRVWYWGQEAGGNSWRTTRDITDEWNVVASIGFFQDVCAPVVRPGCYNDPDMLVVGRLGMGWGNQVHDTRLTADEQYAHISLWCLQSAPLLIGCDLRDMDAFTQNLLTNDEVIDVDQDPLVMPVKKIVTDQGQVWYKYLEDGSVAVGLFNVDPYSIVWDPVEGETIQRTKKTISCRFSDLGLTGRFRVRDLWRQKDLGIYEKEFSTGVAYHGVSFLRLIPEK